MPPKLTEYDKKNPGIVKQFDTIEYTVTGANGRPVKRTNYVPAKKSGYEILTDDVLNSGNLTVLRNFREKHEAELDQESNANAKRYIDARIDAAETIQDLKEEQQQKAALGIPPYDRPEVVEEDGFIGLAGMEYPEYQTSSNGCWSISYSMLLKSRGVDLSQEEIRLWRPDYQEGIPEAQKANSDRKRLMNSDSENSIYPNADLVAQLLPNTAVNMLKLEPFEGGSLTKGEGPGEPLDSEELDIVRTEYHAQVKKKIQDTVAEAVIANRSPLSISWDGHYVTITGISRDGETIRYEDSLGAETGSARTKTIKIDELMRLGLTTHDKKGIEKEPTGLEMVWLSDLPQGEYGNPEKPEFGDGHKDYVKMGADGSISVSLPGEVPGLNTFGSSDQGQIDGKGFEESLEADGEAIAGKLSAKDPGITKIHGWGAKGGVYLGTRATYYPKQTVQVGDPELVKRAKAQALEDVADNLKSLERTHLYDEDQKLAQKYIEDLKNFPKDEKDPKKLAEAKENLKGIYDFLIQKKEGSGKTLFEEATGELNDNARKGFVDSLIRLNTAYELGKDDAAGEFLNTHRKLEAEYQEQQRAARIKAMRLKAEIFFRGNNNRAWETMLENASAIATVETGKKQDNDLEAALRESAREAYKDSLAFIAASYSLHQQMKDNHIDPPYPMEDEVRAIVPSIRKSEAFEKTVTGLRSWNMPQDGMYPFGPRQENYNMTDFLKELAENEKAYREEKADLESYRIDGERFASMKERLAGISQRLAETKTGSYTGLDVISRSKNSDEYEKAKAKIDAIGKAAAPTPKQVRSACGVVLKYLDGKEQVRNRKFGRIRFNECMSFLAECMPRDKFEDYCDSINKKRKVKPGSPDYVAPEQFYVPGTKLSDVVKETGERIDRGEGTLRDYARLIASTNLIDEKGWLNAAEVSVGLKQEKAELTNFTNQVALDKRFRDYISSIPEETLKAQIQNKEFEKLRDGWDSYKLENPEIGKTNNKEKEEIVPELTK